METLARGYGLIEAPLWVPDRGLLFSDVLNGGVFCLDRAGNVSTLFEHRRGIGGMALHEAGGVIVSGRNLSYKPFDGGATVLVKDRDPDAGNVGYNDLTTDAQGRIYAGSLGSSPVFEAEPGVPAEPRAGDLWVVDLDGSSRRVGEDIRLTNGLGFSPDGRTLYHSDSEVRTVWRYDVDANGDLSPKTPFTVTDEGVPDGLVVAQDGSVWVALAGAGGVAVHASDGRRTGFIEIAEPMCTSVCFGGDDLRDLYIVSGSRGADSDRAGAVHRHRVDVPGMPVAAARVRLGRG